MIGRLNHIAIAVPDLDEASKIYRDTLGAEVSEPVPLTVHSSALLSPPHLAYIWVLFIKHAQVAL